MRVTIDVDDSLFEVVRAELGTTTKNDTVNAALCYVVERTARSRAILDDPFFLGGSDLADVEVMSGARR